MIRPTRSPATYFRSAVVVVVILCTAVAGCGSTSTPPTKTIPTTFAEIDALMSSRLRTANLDGAGILVVSNGGTSHEEFFGDYTSDSIIPIASASKWLTAATMMTLVDEGIVSLDDPVSKFLPQFIGQTGNATIRQLLSHTSGIGNAACVWESGQSLERCVDLIASQPVAFQPGEQFNYGNTSFSVAGRIIEVVTGQSFERAFESRIAQPLGMSRTRFDGKSYPTDANPVPAASAESTLDDYGAFVAMIFNRGIHHGVRVLSEQSIFAMEENAVSGVDTNGDSAVRTTGIPTYGLGTWRDITTTSDVGVVTSGNGAYGFYPWVDRSRNGYGLIFVYDQRGAELAVPESQRQMHLIFGVLDSLDGSNYALPTTVYRRP